MNVLFEAIYNKMGTDVAPTTFYTAVGGRLYHVRAPQNATFPYCVFDMITAADELNFVEENDIFQIQFDIFTENNSALSAGVILATLKALYDNCELTVTGWRALSMLREFVVPNNTLIRADGSSRIPPIMGYSVQYEVELEKAQ